MFVEFSETRPAQQFFSKTFVMKNLAILDESFKEMFKRDMRVYLVKTEEEFTQLALAKYQEEIQLAKTGGQGGGAKSTQSSHSNQRGNTGKTQACSDKSSQQQLSGIKKI